MLPLKLGRTRLYSFFFFLKKRENPSSAAAHFLLEQQLQACYWLLMSLPSRRSGAQEPGGTAGGEGNENPKFTIFFPLLASLKYDSSAISELKLMLLVSQRFYFSWWAGCQQCSGGSCSCITAHTQRGAARDRHGRSCRTPPGAFGCPWTRNLDPWERQRTPTHPPLLSRCFVCPLLAKCNSSGAQ